MKKTLILVVAVGALLAAVYFFVLRPRLAGAANPQPQNNRPPSVPPSRPSGKFDIGDYIGLATQGFGLLRSFVTQKGGESPPPEYPHEMVRWDYDTVSPYATDYEPTSFEERESAVDSFYRDTDFEAQDGGDYGTYGGEEDYGYDTSEEEMYA